MTMKCLVGLMATILIGGGVALGLALASAQKTAEAAQNVAEEARTGVQKARRAQEGQEKLLAELRQQLGQGNLPATANGTPKDRPSNLVQEFKGHEGPV